MATDRLRRKLRDVEQADVSALKQDFCRVGTPLPALDSRKKDANELKPIWQQEARDEQGRRRFHGAFTGGFSAGYFNTVGSKEGWTPSSFRSSRADKANGVAAQAPNARPEDYMDEEDLQDRKQTQQVTTSTAFSGPNSDTHDPFDRPSSSREADVELLASALYQQMNPKEKDTLGFRLLRRMGWKEGQGLGARMDAAKRRRWLQRLQGDTVDTLNSGEDIIDAERRHLFAPPKTERPQLEDRIGTYGLGWTPTTSRHADLSATHQARASREELALINGKNLPSIRSAVRPDSDDEDDPYGDETAVSTLDTARPLLPKQRRPVQGQSTPDRDSQETWRDGNAMLSGFQLSSTSALSRSDPPASNVLPAGWAPDPLRVRRLLQTARQNGQKDAGRDLKNGLSPSARGLLLGEAKLPGPPPKMPAFMSQSNQHARLTGLPPKDEFVKVPQTDVMTARLALQGFMPFSNDPEKQDRYRTYLESQLEPAQETARRQLVPPDSTAEDFSMLLQEFASKAAISQLMSSTMANRFTSASAGPSVQDRIFLEPGLRQPGSLPPPLPETTPTDQKLPSADTNTETAAASEEKTTKGRKARLAVDQHWLHNKEQLKAMAASSSHTMKATVIPNTNGASSEDTQEGAMDQLGLGDDQRQGRDTLSYTKPDMVVFKSVFESEDDDDDEDGVDGLKSREIDQERSRSSKVQDSSKSGLTFQAPSKRKDDSGSVIEQSHSTDKKRKRDKAGRKVGMLSFDLDEGVEARPTKSTNKLVQQAQPSNAKLQRRKASDMF